MSYFDIYLQRLNRFGNDYQSRIQGEREKLFDLYLLKSIYRVDFIYNNQHYAGSLEKNKQDNSETKQYLLTQIDLNIPNGTVLKLTDKDNIEQPWMIYYLENIKASGYNRYIVLKMTHLLNWTARDGTEQQSWAYMYGQEDNMLKNEIRSRSRMDTVYEENLKLSFFVMPVNSNLKIDDYFVVGEKPLQEYYRVTGFDIQSTPGVQFVSVDPIYEFDQTPPPNKEPGDNDSDFFWFNGGISDGNP